MLSEATIFFIDSNNIEFLIGCNFKGYNSAILFHYAINHLAQSLLLGWDDLAIKYGHLLLKMLYGKQYNGWHSAYKHSWFMLEIFCKWQNIELDYDKLNYPKNLNIYSDVLKYWDTNDSKKVSELVNKMIDFHLKNSDENEYNDNIPDFPNSDYFIFATEIILWLNIRNKMGLVDYISDNDFMRLPINDWHSKNLPIPNIEIIKRIKDKLKKEYPGSTFEIDY